MEKSASKLFHLYNCLLGNHGWCVRGEADSSVVTFVPQREYIQVIITNKPFHWSIVPCKLWRFMEGWHRSCQLDSKIGNLESRITMFKYSKVTSKHDFAREANRLSTNKTMKLFHLWGYSRREEDKARGQPTIIILLISGQQERYKPVPILLTILGERTWDKSSNLFHKKRMEMFWLQLI